MPFFQRTVSYHGRMVVNWKNTSYSSKQLYFNYNNNKIDNTTQNMQGQLIMKFWVYEVLLSSQPSRHQDLKTFNKY